MMRIYQDLGVRRFINAAGTYTRLGGSRMPSVVVAAMADAARHFVDMDELQLSVGARLAVLTRNEAAYVTSGAAAGLTLAAAACMAGTDPGRARQLPDVRGLRNQVVMQRAHRNPYDYAVRLLPIELVEIGYPNQITPVEGWELEHVLGEHTAAVLYVAGGWTSPGSLPLPMVAEIAHRHGVPVIVDAAAQLPPKENLWRFTQLGADLAIFSGGKDLRGPQSTGLIVGRRDLVAACVLLGAPHHGIARGFKVGKEEMAGLLAAVQRYVEQDEEARLQWTESFVASLIERLGGPHLRVERSFPNEAGQPMPRALCRVLGEGAVSRRDDMVALLRSGDPSVEVGVADADADSFYVNPMTVDPDEADALLARLCAVAEAVEGVAV
jgi:D-glucosaminate-6-phosphate ammonia-lyase